MSDTIVEAVPRALRDIARLPQQDEVVVAARQRGITEVLHFTTTKNLVGIIASGYLKCRNLVSEDHYVENVYDPNCGDRSRDAIWTGYVNMSISRINAWMFQSSTRWHLSDGNSWVVLAFDPVVLGHPGVIFATTNNAYRGICLRAEGKAGFDRMFGDRVRGYNRELSRGSLDPKYPTDRCAEVLYPEQLSIEYLTKLYVQIETDQDHIPGILTSLDCRIPLEYVPEVFA
jgi:hypothetical protein